MTNAVGESVKDSDQLMIRLRQYGEMKEEYDKIKDALDSVKASGYGVVIPQSMWATNVFGKSVEQMVNDGIHAKISGIGPESQEKLQDCMQKIVNESNGGMVCIII